MDIDVVADLCRSFEAAGLKFWVDGGWGVDALLEQQTRAHSDLDLAVTYRDLPAFQDVLVAKGFTRADRLGDPEWNWVLQDAKGQSVDLHGFVPDDQGNGVLGDPSKGEKYPAEAFTGSGRLGALPVRCIAATVVLEFRNSFSPRDVDHHDVKALCEHFSLPVPSRFLPLR
jgi:lincosamide nucleotidyltransferase A/C/D/E